MASWDGSRWIRVGRRLGHGHGAGVGERGKCGCRRDAFVHSRFTQLAGTWSRVICARWVGERALRSSRAVQKRTSVQKINDNAVRWDEQLAL